MGRFAGTIVIIDSCHDQIAGAFREIQLQVPLQPVGDGIWGIVDECIEDISGWEEMVKKLALCTSDAILGIYVYDDDFLLYILYANGMLVDRYNSCPDYFGETEEAATTRGGDANRLADAFSCGDVDALHDILHESKYVFASDHLRALCDVLKIPEISKLMDM